MSSIQQEQLEFMCACGMHTSELSLRTDSEHLHALLLAQELIKEEAVEELIPAINRYICNPTWENMAEMADGIVDTVYVLMQLCNTLGLPFDKLWDCVHASNMAKVDKETGKVIRREDGKILKPEGWQPPDLLTVLWTYAEQYRLDVKDNPSTNRS